MNYSKPIKIIRASKGLSQRGLASILEVDSSLISKIEAGREPSRKFIEAFCTKLSIPIELFFLLAKDNKESVSGYKVEDLAKSLLTILIDENEQSVDLPTSKG